MEEQIKDLQKEISELKTQLAVEKSANKQLEWYRDQYGKLLLKIDAYKTIIKGYEKYLGCE